MSHQSNVSSMYYTIVGETSNNSLLPPAAQSPHQLIPTVIFAIVGVSIIIVIIIGNSLVILSIVNEARLQRNRQNLLIGSLASADLLVGVFVMPLTLIYELTGEWIMGNIVCELWLALDVLFVTASILHLCAISLDRYWSVTKPMSYPPKRTTSHMIKMSIIAWLVSFAISFPPLLGWRPVRKPLECLLSEDLGYVLYSALGSFYVPVIILIVVYTKIYWISHQALKQRVKQTEKNQQILNADKCAVNPPARQNRAVSVAHGGNGTLLITTTNSSGKQIRDTRINQSAMGNGVKTIMEEDETEEKCKTARAEQHTLRPLCVGQLSLQLQSTPDMARSTGGGDYFEFTPDSDERTRRRYERCLRNSSPDVVLHASSTLIDSRLLNVSAKFRIIDTAIGDDTSFDWENNTVSHISSGGNTTPEQDESEMRKRLNAVLKVIFDKNRTWVTQMEKRMKQRAQLKKRLKRLKQKERQATILLGLILVGFIACWLPFFMLYLLSAMHVQASKMIFVIFFWLGYCNSGVNPVIYTIFQKDFRIAMHKQIKRYCLCASRY